MRNAESLLKIILSKIIIFGLNLVKPHRSINENSNIRISQLAAGLALASIVLNLSGFIAVYSLFGLNLKTISLLLNILLAFTAYGLSKSPFYRIGGYLLVMTPVLNGIIVLVSGGDNPGFSLYTTVPVAIIYASLLLL